MTMDLISLKYLQWLTIIQQLLNLIYHKFTSNAGIAKTNQNSFAQIISKDDYPVFSVNTRNI